MWKVVVTEIQDASALEPFDVPVGAFFVCKERLARTVQDVDLPWLIEALEAMQSPPECAREARPVPSQGTPPNRRSRRANASPEPHRLDRKRAGSTLAAAKFLSKNGP